MGGIGSIYLIQKLAEDNMERQLKKEKLERLKKITLEKSKKERLERLKEITLERLKKERLKKERLKKERLKKERLEKIQEEIQIIEKNKKNLQEMKLIKYFKEKFVI